MGEPTSCRPGVAFPKATVARYMTGSKRRLVAAIAAGTLVGLAACSSDPGPGTMSIPAPDSGTTVASATLSGQITEVWLQPYPEGSHVVSYRNPPATDSTALYSGTRFDAFVTTIGWPLPDPLPQPHQCQRGRPNYTVIVMLDNGTQPRYGPCSRPAVVEQAVKQLNAGF